MSGTHWKAWTAAAAFAVLPIAGEVAQTYSAAVAEIVRAERDGKWEEALAGTEALLAEADARGLAEYQRAELHFAAGVVLAGRSDVEDPDEFRQALPPFESARALAGPGDLRLDAGYDLGVTELRRAEVLRTRIPELGGGQPNMAMTAAPPPPQAPPTPPAAGGAEKEVDPLEAAREAYLTAKGRFLDRLRADWRDADTRANLELIQRRLHELDEIEKQREEQQPEQQQQNQDQQGEDGEKSKDENAKDQEGKSDEQKDPQDKKEGEEGEQDPSKDQADQNPDEGGEQETDPLETDGAEQEPPPPEQGPTAPAEKRLTKEEVTRYLQQLGEIEEKGERLRQLLKQAQRIPVKKDW